MAWASLSRIGESMKQKTNKNNEDKLTGTRVVAFLMLLMITAGIFVLIVLIYFVSQMTAPATIQTANILNSTICSNNSTNFEFFQIQNGKIVQPPIHERIECNNSGTMVVIANIYNTASR